MLLQTVSLALAALLSVASSASVGSPMKPVSSPVPPPIIPHHTPRGISAEAEVEAKAEVQALAAPAVKPHLPVHHPRRLPSPSPSPPHGIPNHHGTGPRSTTGDVLSCVAAAADGLLGAPAYDGCHDLCAALLDVAVNANVDAEVDVNVAGIVAADVDADVEASVSLSLGPHKAKFWSGNECKLAVTNPDCDKTLALTVADLAPYCLSALSCMQAGLDAHLDVEALGVSLVLSLDAKVGDVDVCAA